MAVMFHPICYIPSCF